MEKLNVIDRSFLRLESARHPFHVGGLLIFKPPEGASSNYVRKMVSWGRQLNTLWPALNKKLTDPEDLSKAVWVQEENYQPDRHVLHYALPSPGRMEDLLNLVSRAHERQLDRSRPMWEMHIIEGLPRDRFAVYCKIHHALIDGAGGMRMLSELFSTSPDKHLSAPEFEPPTEKTSGQYPLLRAFEDVGRGLIDQYKAIPQVSSLLIQMGRDALRGEEDTMKLPFTSPRTIFNTDTDSSRRLVLCDLPMSTVKRMAKKAGGSINDILLAICGGALRNYLLSQDALPKKSLLAGIPVSVRREDVQDGNQLSFILCPFFTNEKDDLKRLRRVIKTTGKAKSELAKMSKTAGIDLTGLILMPTVLLTLSGNANLVSPAVNAIFSNVPGSSRKLYMEGSELESLYPLSIVTDGLGINLTVISYNTKLCFAITSCPTQQPGIEKLDRFLKESYQGLRDAMKN